MLQTLLIGALAGGATAFVWGAISWMLLPWHHATFLAFTDEDAVIRTIVEQAPRSGVYGIPAPPRGATREQRAKADEIASKRMQSGPLVMAVINRGGFGPVGPHMLGAFAINAIAAAILTWLLLQTTGLGYAGRVEFVGLAGLSGAVICRLTDWNWHGYSTSYTAVCVADTLIGWTLVGVTLAAVV